MYNAKRIALVWAAAIDLLAIGTIHQAKAETNIASAADTAEGDRLAHALCVNCHLVDNHTPVTRTDRVPSFSWIAQQPGLTQEFLRGWLSTSHERMSDYTLTRDEIRQLSAYIVSLKKT